MKHAPSPECKTLCRSAKPFLHKEHEFLLSLVGEFHILHQLRELSMAVMRQYERVPCLAEEVDEVTVVARRDVCESRVRGVNVRSDCSLEQLPEGRSVVAQWLDTAATRATTAVVMVVVVVLALRRVRVWVRARHPWRSDGATSQDVRQDCGTLYILYQQRDHVAQLLFSKRVAQGTRPVNVVDGWVSVLKQYFIINICSITYFYVSHLFL